MTWLPCIPWPPPPVLTTFQVGVVAIAIVAGTCLLLGLDANTGSLEGLEAWVEALATAARSGAGSAAALQPSVDAMLAFAGDQLGGKVRSVAGLRAVGPRAGCLPAAASAVPGASSAARWDVHLTPVRSLGPLGG